MASRVKPQTSESVEVPTLVPEGRHLGKASLPLSRALTLVGSRHRAHLHLLSRSVSKTHALLISTDTGVYIRDLASRTHVLVNGKSVIETYLHNGDRVQIGSFTFRFADPVRKLPRHVAPPPQCSLEVDGSSLAVAAEGRSILIGRRNTCDITLTEPSVSICHAVIFELNGKHFIRDLGSRTGTFVNGNNVHQHPLNFGDAIRIGETDLRFVAAGHQRDIDELEDLVGTASLEDESVPLLSRQKISPDAPVPITGSLASSEDDLIPLAPEGIPDDVAAPSVEEVQVTAAAPMEPAELDLASDPDIAGPGDTARLIPTSAEVRYEPPALSPRIIDHTADAVDLHAEIHGDDESQLLVDASLHEERMTGSGTFVEVEAQTEDAVNRPAQSIDIAPPADDFGLEFHDGVVQAQGPSFEGIPGTQSLSQPSSDAPVETLNFAQIEPPTESELRAESIAPEPTVPPEEEISPETESIVVEAGGAHANPGAPVPEAESVGEGSAAAFQSLMNDRPPVTTWEPAAPAEVDLSSSDFRLGSRPTSDESLEPFPEELPSERAEAPARLLGLEVEADHAPPPIDASTLMPAEQEAEPPEVEESHSSVGESIDRGFHAATEVIEVTEPTPESAQELEAAYSNTSPLSEEDSAAILASDEPLTDSTFGRDVQEFSGSGLGPLVEPMPASSAPELPVAVDIPAPIPEVSHFAGNSAQNVEPEFSFEDLAEQVLASEESLEEPTEYGEEIGFVTEELPPVSAIPFEEHVEPALDLRMPPPPIPQSITAGTSVFDMGGDELIEIEEDADVPLTLDSPETVLPQSDVPMAAENESKPPPLDPYFGMSRDSASFIGGVPLILPPVALPFAAGNAAKLPVRADAVEPLTLSASERELPIITTDLATPEPASIVPELPSDPLVSEPLETLTTEESIDFSDGEETIGSFLSRLEASEPPAELFESTPDALDALPDSMGTLSEITDVLGEHAGPTTPSLEKWDAGMPQLIDEAPGPLQSESAPLIEPPLEEAGEIRDEPVADHRAPQISASMPVAPVTTTAATGPARPSHPRVPAPPPRATRMRAHSRPLNADPLATDGDVDSITIPPFQGFRPATEGQVTTAFDGLAMPPVREVDIFSQSLNPGFDGPFSAPSPSAGTFGAASGAATAAGLIGMPAVGVDALASPPSPLAPSRGRRAGIGVARPALHPPKVSPTDREPVAEPVDPAQYRRTISPQFAPPTPPKASRRRRLPLGWLLPLMILLAGACAAGIWYGVRSEGTAQASLRFENLNHLTEVQRSDFEKRERELLMKPDLRQFARQYFENNFNGHASAGLLYPGLNEEKAYSILVDNASVPPNSQHLLIHYASTDPRSDALRFRALLEALFRANQPLADAAASLKAAFNKNDQEVQQIHNRMDELTRSLADEQKASADAAPLQNKLDQLKAENSKLWKSWTDAAALVRDTQATIDHLELAGPSVPATAANGEPLKPDDDPQVKEFAARLKELQAGLTSARSAHSASADRANKALDLALSDFQKKIMQARANLKDGSELSSYLIAAQQAQDTIRQLNADLVERQKSEQQRLAELRRVLSEKQEARLKSVWAADPDLKRMQDDLAVKEHRYNAAAGSGLNDDAKQLQGEIDALKKQIDARRDLIGTGDIYADEVKDLQTFIDDNLKAMDAERSRNDQRMQEQLKALAAAAPRIEKLPADQKAQAEEFEKRLADLNDARKQYAAAMASATPDSDEQVKKLESESTEVQAKLDARRKQLADENRKTLTRQQEEARLAALDEAKRKLTVARKAEEDASLAVRANKENIDDLQTKLDHLKGQNAKLNTDATLIDQLNASLVEKKTQADAEYQALQQSPIPVQPIEEDVTFTELKDPRLQYILITLLGFAITTVILTLVSRPPHEIPVADHAPFQEVEFEHDHASALEPRGPGPLRANGNGQPEDRPLAV